MLNEGGIDLGMQDTLRAIADPTRREILNLLKHSRLSAGEICNHFSVSDAAVSRHKMQQFRSLLTTLSFFPPL